MGLVAYNFSMRISSLLLILGIGSSVALTSTGLSADMRALPLRTPLGTNWVGDLAPDTVIHLSLGLKIRDKAGLEQTLAEIYDPSSHKFHHFLTPAEFTDRFGPSPEAYAAAVEFARNAGLTVESTYENRMVLDVSGSVGVINKAFNVDLKAFKHPSEARQYFAPSSRPLVPASLEIQDIQGLSDYFKPRPHLHKANASPRVGNSPTGSYIGSDFRKAYFPTTTLTGAGQSVGLLEFDGYYTADITAYAQQAGMTAVPLKNVLLNNFNGKAGANNGEVSLDIDMAMAMAPGLSNIVVYEGNLPNSMLSKMTKDTYVKQFSSSWSWGLGVDTTTDQLFQQLAAQGQSFYEASGDSGAYTGQIDTPSDNPYITVVGGTTLTTSSSGNWSSETTWNWGGGTSTGGGISTDYTIPTWQVGSVSSASKGSTSMRNIPDVALTADNVYSIYDNGTTGDVGGTSCAAPLWAAVTALVNQQVTQAGGTTVGFLNPLLYSLGKNSPSLFHDIRTGNNSGFSAVTGLDLCTGLGTPNGDAMLMALAGTNSVSPSSASVTVSISPSTVLSLGARWSLDGGSAQASGATLTNLSVGSHTLSYSSVSNWIAPASQTIVLSAGANVLAGTYTAVQYGSVLVTLEPTQAAFLGGWQLDGGSYNKSDVTVTKVPTGTHVLTFAAVTGLATPSPLSITVSANRVLSTNVVYSALPTGSVTVTLAPTAVAGVGKWSLDGGVGQASGASLSGIPIGVHGISACAVPSWVTPAGKSVSVTSNTQSTATLTYLPLVASYHGLFSPTNNIGSLVSGSISLSLASNRSYSGTLSLNGVNTQCKGTVSSGGVLSGQSGLLSWVLQVTPDNSGIFGYINEGSVLAEVYAYRDPANVTAGKYTFALSDSNSGYGYGAISFASSGVVSMAGVFGDNVAFSLSSRLNGSGVFPVYYRSTSDFIWGWVNCTNTGDSQLAGNLAWQHHAKAGTLPYPGGLTNSVELVGSSYGTNASVFWGQYLTVYLSDTNLVNLVAEPIYIGSSGKVVNWGSLPLSMSIKANGEFTGSVQSPLTGKQISFSGAMLPSQLGGFGLYTNGASTGTVLIY